jgi:hypothetical protein
LGEPSEDRKKDVKLDTNDAVGARRIVWKTINMEEHNNI